FVGFVKHGSRRRKFLRQILPHPGVLRSLSGKHHYQLAHFSRCLLLRSRLCSGRAGLRPRRAPLEQKVPLRFSRLPCCEPTQSPRESHFLSRSRSTCRARLPLRPARPASARHHIPSNLFASKTPETRHAK